MRSECISRMFSDIDQPTCIFFRKSLQILKLTLKLPLKMLKMTFILTLFEVSHLIIRDVSDEQLPLMPHYCYYTRKSVYIIILRISKG